MILSRAPLRISLAGGGSDLPSYYREHSGSVLSFTINKFVYVALHSFFSGGIRLAYSATEHVSSIEQIKHPLIRETLMLMDYRNSIEISSMADVPGNGTGLGSSSAFTVALLRAIHQKLNLPLTPKLLAEMACKVELELCGEPIGKQDQFASAFGGLKTYAFHKDDQVEIISDPTLENKSEFLENSLSLFYTDISRSSSEILKHQNSLNLEGNSQATQKIAGLLDEMTRAVRNEDHISMGRILNENWSYKKSISQNSTSTKLEEIYQRALTSGFIGGKLVGAGGGGFLLLVSDPRDKRNLIEKLHPLKHLPFKFHNSGAEIVFSDEN